MTRSNLKVISLDFDGTLVVSNEIKDNAFEKIFSDWPEHKQTMIEWHKSRNTIDRREKFRYFVEEVLKEKGNFEMVVSLVKRFTDLTQQAIINCPWVDGAFEFLEYFKTKLPLYLVSATPKENLDEIITKRDIKNSFQKVYGSPLDKFLVLQTIMKREHVETYETLYIGDSPEDKQAAKDSGVNFIGLDSGRDLMTKNLHTDFHSILHYINSQYKF